MTYLSLIYKIKIKFMKKIIFTLIMMVISSYLNAQIQRTPYTLSPEWRFGNKAGLSFPEIGSPFTTPTTSNPANGDVESSTGICDTQSVIASYSDTRNVYNKTGGLIRNIETTDNIASGSATEGGIMIPDPSSPFDTYYFFTANDISGGTKQYKGINYYKLKKNGSNVVIYNSGPSSIIGTTPLNLANSMVDESLTSTPDGNGNYWLISRSNSSATFYVWKITALGIGGRTDYPVLTTPTVSNAQSSIKVNLCQNKLAWNGSGVVRVYSFDRTTGAIGNTPIYNNLGGADFLFNKSPYEVEFSQDGSKLYVSSMNWSQISEIDLAGSAGNGTVISSSETWGLQLAPDGNIYGSGSAGGSNLYVISNANTLSPSINSMSLQSGSTVYRGISNEAFLNPNQPIITTSSSGATFTFNYKFRTYFNDTITILSGSEIWDFGDGSALVNGIHKPTHTYSSVGPYTVLLKFKDNFCNHNWQDTIIVNPNIALPVDFIMFDGYVVNNKVNLVWRREFKEKVEIYKSIDDRNFTKIGESYGNQFVDESMIGGYYRLVSRDNYTNIIYVGMENINPFYKIINNEVVFHDIYHYELYTYDGKIIKQGNTNFYLSELQQGFYLIKMMSIDNHIINDKIVIK